MTADNNKWCLVEKSELILIKKNFILPLLFTIYLISFHFVLLKKNTPIYRFILARGQARYLAENYSVGLFLFSDVIIVARKLNRKYWTLVTLSIDSNFETSRDGLEVTFKNESEDFAVTFSQLDIAVTWHQYASMWKQYKNYSSNKELCPKEGFSATASLHLSILW